MLQAARRPTRLPPLQAPRSGSRFVADAVCAHQTGWNLPECACPPRSVRLSCPAGVLSPVGSPLAASLPEKYTARRRECAKNHASLCERSQLSAGDESRKCPMCGHTTGPPRRSLNTPSSRGRLGSDCYSCHESGFTRWHRMDKSQSAPVGSRPGLAMQKVEGSSPFIRFDFKPFPGLLTRGRAHLVPQTAGNHWLPRLELGTHARVVARRPCIGHLPGTERQPHRVSRPKASRLLLRTRPARDDPRAR
jgi:hypothetical protein